MFGLSRKTWIIGAVVAAISATGAIAAKNFSNTEKRMEKISERVSERFNLNETQKGNFEQVTASLLSARGGTGEFMLNLSGQLKELAADKTITQEEANLLRDQIKAEFDRRSEIVIPQFVTFYNSLDDAQKAQMMERVEKIESRIEGRMERYNKRYGNDKG
ncbi:MAG: hypothetical protein AB8B49_11095 [Nitratireductor sp.]